MTPEQVLDYPHRTPPPGGETREVVPGVHWLRMPLPFALDHINLWLLEDGDELAIVDCGFGNEPTRELWQQIFASFFRGRTVRRVVATHLHPDHAGNAGWLTERFGAPLFMSQGDYLMAHAWRDEAAGFTVDALVTHLARNGLDGDRVAALGQRGNAYRRAVPEFPLGYKRLVEGNEIVIGGRAWRIIMGYGHAPEHASLYCASLGVLISGDMLLPRISTNISVNQVDAEANPLALFLWSLRRFVELLPAETLVLPSHGLPFRGMRERVAQLEEHHRLRLGELEEVCGEPKSAADVIGTLFRRELDVHQTFFAIGEALAHLNYLAHEGILSRGLGADGVVRFVRNRYS